MQCKITKVSLCTHQKNFFIPITFRKNDLEVLTIACSRDIDRQSCSQLRPAMRSIGNKRVKACKTKLEKK